MRISVDQGQSNSEQIGWAVSQVTRYILLLLCPIALVIALNSNSILNLLFGSAYASFPNAPLALSLLVVVYVLWGIVYLLHTVLRSLGEKRFFLVTGIGIIVFELISAWSLTGLLGLIGATITRVFYVVLLFLLSLGKITQKKVKLDFSSLSTVPRIVLASLTSGIVLMLASPFDLLSLSVWLGISILVYLLLLLLLRAVTRFDFRLAKSVMPQFLHGLIERIERRVLG